MGLCNQTVGNIGLFYVCYHLSRLGWNVMPTARNARGVDVLIYSDDALTKYTIQVKSLSKCTPAPLGRTLDHLIADFLVIFRERNGTAPECFILNPREARQLAHRGERGGKVSYWLQQKQYESPAFRDRWDRIGTGSPQLPVMRPEPVTPSALVKHTPTPQAEARLVSHTASSVPRARDFRRALEALFAKNLGIGAGCIDVSSGDLHRQVGSYPSGNHRMRTCCDIMRKEMGDRDQIVSEPPKGRGASLVIRYMLPR